MLYVLSLAKSGYSVHRFCYQLLLCLKGTPLRSGRVTHLNSFFYIENLFFSCCRRVYDIAVYLEVP